MVENFCKHGLPVRAFCARCVDDGVMSKDEQIAAGCSPVDTRALRDHFAGLAMQGMLSSSYGRVVPEEISEHAYAIADAMLSAREAGK